MIVDATLGAGGHAAAILERIGPQGRLIGIDRDPDALGIAAKTLERYGDKTMIVRENYRNISKVLDKLEIEKVDGMLLDLGVSSMQLDTPGRGFSFKADGPLDMRMDPSQKMTAETIVNRATQKELEDILFQLGEERYSRRIARAICERRELQPITTTGELEKIIFHAVPTGYRHGRIHPATRSFQALRLAVNEELSALEVFLSSSLAYLRKHGRMVVITFHSLEDRIVKHRFREFEKGGSGRILTKKPHEAESSEIETNPRSRSAKLRAFEAA